MTSFSRALAPATSANLGSGFDVLGVALDCLHDVVGVEVVSGEGVRIEATGKGSRSVPIDPGRNTAGVVAKELLAASRERRGLKLTIEKGIAPGSGLGSSAASAAAAAVAVNESLGLGLSLMELVPVAARGEVASAGAPHADNVAPALLGYFTLVRSYDPIDVVQLPSRGVVEFVVLIPSIGKKDTAAMRAVLPRSIELSQLVYNVGRVASLVAGIVTGDLELMGKGMSDAVIESARSHFYPGLQDAKEEVLRSGAKGVALSGAGPSLIVLVGSGQKSKDAVASAGIAAFARHGISCEALVTRPGPGARLIRGDPA
ncbi:MAG: homoserine kinase [Conexivisphaerales archaeon]|jgi:homoserine kinase